MEFSDIEYIGLRLLRKFLLPSALLRRFQQFLPYYEPSTNENCPASIVDLYCRHCNAKGIDLAGKTVLEIGVGATNGTGYELVVRGVSVWYGYEPYEAYRRTLDQTIMERVHTKQTTQSWQTAIRRITTLDAVQDRSVDLAFSHSVLEHVRDPYSLFQEIAPKLAPNARMIHIVDYRDHFFKYPYHFLKFSNHAWHRFLDPGDLPRHRFSDHADSLKRIGFRSELISKTGDKTAFDCVRSRIHAEFRRFPEEDLSMTGAVIYAQKEPS